jgi:hypothetical protein
VAAVLFIVPNVVTAYNYYFVPAVTIIVITTEKAFTFYIIWVALLFS